MKMSIIEEKHERKNEQRKWKKIFKTTNEKNMERKIENDKN